MLVCHCGDPRVGNDLLKPLRLLVSAEEHAELSRETALTSASLQIKNEFASVAQYSVGQLSIMR
jgi:hypothetical protein